MAQKTGSKQSEVVSVSLILGAALVYIVESHFRGMATKKQLRTCCLPKSGLTPSKKKSGKTGGERKTNIVMVVHALGCRSQKGASHALEAWDMELG